MRPGVHGLHARALLGRPTGAYNRGMARKNQSPPKNFEEALQELERIVAEIEKGEVGLEESLVRYERGCFLIRHCQGVLDGAEKQIEQITRAQDGTLSAEPLAGGTPAPESAEE